MATMLLYERPVALNREEHKHLRIKAGTPDFGFSRAMTSVPIAGVEFPRAALEYPVVFAGPADQKRLPVALLGLQQNQNLFVGENGAWMGGYIPAFIRRYPFVLAQQPERQDFTVCIDRAFTGWVESAQAPAAGEQPLFEADGKESQLLQGALNFLSEYQGHILKTQEFVNKINELNLLIPQTLQVVGQDGKKIAVDGFSIVDENKFRGLPDATLLDLQKQGFTGWIYAHLISLANAQRLQARMAKVG